MKTNKVKIIYSVLLFAFCLTSVTYATTFDNKPPVVATPLPPNILYIKDDSGSMRWGFMPDDLVVNRTWDIPYTSSPWILSDSNCSSSGSYAGISSACFLNLSNKRYMVSSHLNTIYYNPAVTYLPPIRANGTRFPNATFTNAKVNGYNEAACHSSSNPCINLSTNYRAIMDDYYWISREVQRRRWVTTTAGFTISPSANAVNAFYFEFTGTSDSCRNNPYQNDCYTRRDIGTGAAERQNFANWFSYYRTRLMSSKAGTMEAFANLPNDFRVGYGTVNTSGISGVRPYAAQKNSFYNWIINLNASGGTPLRAALDRAGQYFSTAEPWLRDPTDINSGELSCRQSFTILMTDGYWSEGSGDAATTGAARDDNDSTACNTAGDPCGAITGPDGRYFLYGAGAPFADNRSNTLADVASYYWKSDLRTNLTNNVPTSDINPAFWQHMSTIGLTLGVEGTISKTTAFNALATGQAITWPNPIGSDSAKIDDLLHAAINSRGDFFSAQNPGEFAQGLSDSLATIRSRLGSATSLSTGEATGGNKVFKASYRSGNWSGELGAYAVTSSGVSSTATWIASNKIPDPVPRNIFTLRNNGNGVVFTRQGLDNSQAAFFGANNNDRDKLINYLRGERANEIQNPAGVYRNRGASVLGSIIHSTPVFVESPALNRFNRFNWPELTSYPTFVSDNINRSSAVYAGGSDGMLHGFDAETGAELFAFIPPSLLPRLPNLSNPNYEHEYMVDGMVSVADVYISSNWRTVLVGSLGRGGKTIYAVDVTDPSSMSGNNFLWETTHAEMGNFLGKPQIIRKPSGEWVALFGNGLNSTSKKAALIVVSLSNGAITVINTDAGSAALPNGLGAPFAWDSNLDGNFETVYAGDMLGNVWAFNLVTNAVRKVFQAKDDNDKVQPITAGVIATKDPATEKTWIFFGTGQFLTQSDVFDTSVQTWYGIIDEGTTIPNRSSLRPRTISTQATIFNNQARVIPAAASQDMDGKRGWYLDLKVGAINLGERMVFSNIIRGKVLIGSTLIPTGDVCQPGGDGFVMTVNPFTGANLGFTFFDYSGDGDFTTLDLVNGNHGSGISFGSTPSMPVFVDNKMIVQLEDTRTPAINTPPPATTTTTMERLSWRELY